MINRTQIREIHLCFGWPLARNDWTQRTHTLANESTEGKIVWRQVNLTFIFVERALPTSRENSTGSELDWLPILCVANKRNISHTHTMPKTQKENLSLDQLRQEAINHNIEFPGIVLPDEWPPTYRNYFRTIRSIGFISEENFNDSQFIPDRQKVALQDRADKLRIQAKDLLSKPNQKETAWRKLEAPVLERFSSSIHW